MAAWVKASNMKNSSREWAMKNSSRELARMCPRVAGQHHLAAIVGTKARSPVHSKHNSAVAAASS